MPYVYRLYVIFCCTLSPSQQKQRRPYQILCVIGGWDGQTVVQSVEWYDPDLGQWQQGPSLYQPRKRLGVASHNGKVYAIGGHDGKQALNSVEVFDQTTRQWTLLPAMNQARMFAACATLNGKIYAIGGQCRLGVPLDSAEVFDPALNQWQLIPSMRSKLGSPIAVTHKGSIYVLGRGLGDLYSLQIYSHASNTWTLATTTIPYRRYTSAVYYNDTIFILCGSNSATCRCTHGVENDCVMYKYNPDSRQWSTECQIPGPPRAGFAAAEVNGGIVVVGGHRGREKLSSADLYDPVAREWRSLPAMTSGGRCVLGAVAVEQLALL